MFMKNMNRFKPGASCVIRVSMCVPYVSFVCPGSPRCLFTGTTSVAHYMTINCRLHSKLETQTGALRGRVARWTTHRWGPCQKVS